MGIGEVAVNDRRLQYHQLEFASSASRELGFFCDAAVLAGMCLPTAGKRANPRLSRLLLHRAVLRCSSPLRLHEGVVVTGQRRLTGRTDPFPPTPPPLSPRQALPCTRQLGGDTSAGIVFRVPLLALLVCSSMHDYNCFLTRNIFACLHQLCATVSQITPSVVESPLPYLYDLPAAAGGLQ